jgi:hypothetical protein
MRRRLFLQTCIKGAAGLAVLAGGGTSAALVARSPRENRLVTHVTGAPYRIGFETPVESVFRPGQWLRVMRGPGYRHASQPILLYLGEEHIGYLPRSANPVLAPIMDGARDLFARILAVDPEDPWRGIRIEVSWSG